MHPTGTNQKKSDVLALFSGNFMIGINIKAGKNDFNQITRMWLDNFSEKINISQNTKNAIQNGIDNHRLKRSKIFIEDKFKNELKKDFSNNLKNILELIFKGFNNDIVKILTLYDRMRKMFYLYDMDKVINSFSNDVINFSNNGVIGIGKYITMQRKGGNGVKKNIPKSDIKHPGNQIQFKLKILTFMNENEPLLKF